MPDCVDLTLDSDDENAAGLRGRKRSGPPTPDSDCIIVDGDPEPDQQHKRQRLDAAADEEDADVVVESATGTVALRDMAHARPQCGNHAFRAGNSQDNSKRCSECYCFVCDIKAEECQYWGNGIRARDHCNAHTSHYWNSLRKAARKGSSSATLLRQEFSSSSNTLSTNWTVPGANASANSGIAAAAAARRSMPAAGVRGITSPLVALWQRQKSAHNPAHTPPAPAATPAAAAAAGGGSTPATAPGRLEEPRSAVKTEGSKQQQQQSKPKPLPKRPASSWLKRLPAPAHLKTPTQLLVRLELPFKTVKGVTVDEVARRLVPTGFYKDPTKPFNSVQYGEHISLDNINSVQYVAEKRKQVPEALKLLPLVPVDGLPSEPDTDRPYKVTVISTTPGVKPMAVGVVVPAGCKVSKLKCAVEEALAAHSYSSRQEGLLLGYIRRGVSDDAPVGPPTREGSIDWFDHLDAARLVDSSNYTNRHNTLLAVRVPADVAKAYYDNNRSGLSDQPSAPKILLLQHEKFVPLAEGATPHVRVDSEEDSDDDDDDDEDFDTEDEESDFLLLHGRSWTTQEQIDWRERHDKLCRRHQQQQQDTVVELGIPMAVLVPAGMGLNGGPSAVTALKKAIIEHLVHYRTSEGAAPSSRASDWNLTVCRSSGWVRQRSALWRPTWDFSVHSDNLYTPYRHPGVRLWVHWGTDPVAHPPGFDLEGFTAVPQLDDPGFQQRLNELPELLKAAADYANAMKMLKGMPNDVIRELQMACACSVPPPSHSPADLAKHVTHKPLAAVQLSVIKAPGGGGSSSGGAHTSSSKEAAKVAAAGSSAAAAIAAAAAQEEHKRKTPDLQRLGVLQVEVHVFTTSGRLHLRLFEDYDNWGCTVSGRPGRFTSTKCILTTVLNARLLQEAGGYTLLKQINELNGSGKPAHGIAKLMEWVAAGERAAAEQPPGLTVQLHPYQLQSLAFMQEAERWEGGWRHLLWKWLPPTTQQQQQQQQQARPSSSSSSSAAAGGAVSAQPGVGPGVWWSPVLGRVASEVPTAPWGGFLAEEMGLGKTVEVLGLILSNPAPPSVVAGSPDPESGKIRSRGTLVVCAVSLVGQWCTEASKKLNGSLKMYPYHGQNRIRNRHRLATEFDIVVTTYATLGSDFGGKKNQHRADNPLGDIKWHRIVYDEGHTVKNMSAAHSKACTALTSDRRWICTGTPINNDINDLLGQFSVLHMQPFATKSYFDAYVKHVFASYGYGVSAVPLLYTLRHVMIRHTKAQTIQGQSVLALPPKTEDLVPVVLSPAEREAYGRVHSEAARVWAAVRTMSHSDINKKLLQVMSLLQPLRRICSGGRLTPRDLNVPDDMLHEASAANVARPAAAGMSMAAAAAAAGGPLQVQEDCSISVPDLECPICLDAFDTPVMTLCHHWFCKECILGVLSGTTHCPLCRRAVTPTDLRAPGHKPAAVPKKRRRSRSSDGSDSEGGSGSEGDEGSDEDAAEAAGSSDLATRRVTRSGSGATDGNAVVCESKLRALLAELTAMRERDPTSKALVFSQYSNTLDWLKQRLPEEGFGYRTITGSMPLKQRSKAIEAFQSDPPTTVFLLSIRSGAVGINLTAANHVFLLEPCINPALEEQAIGRAWRMGQTRKVVVKRFYVKGSIEERIMDVRNIRQGHATHAGAGSSAAAAGARSSDSDSPPARMGKKKIGAAELAGNLQADRQVLKIAELDLLFRTPDLETSAGVRAAGDGAGSSRQAEAAAAAAAGGDGAGSSRQAEAAAAAAAGSGGQQPGGAPPAALAAAAGGVVSMGPPADRPGPSAAAAAGGSGLGADRPALSAAAAGGSELGADLPGQEARGADGVVRDGEAAAEVLPELASQEARALAEAAGLQSSQEMTPYLMAQLQQQQRAWQLFEQRRQEEQQQ